MTRNGIFGVLAVVVLFIASTAVHAFEPLFFVTETHGTSSIELTGAQPKTVIAPRAYPYGSRIRTPADGSVTLELSEHNVVTVGPDTTISIVEDAENKLWKRIAIEGGAVQLHMADKFDRDEFGQPTTRRLTVVTPALMADPITGGEYSILVTQRQDVAVCEFTATRSEMRLYDDLLFEIPAIKHDHRLSATVAADGNYLRVCNVRGRYLMELKHLTDASENPKVVEMAPDSVIKIRRRRIGESSTWVVTTLVVDPNGKLLEELSYRVDATN